MLKHSSAASLLALLTFLSVGLVLSGCARHVRPSAETSTSFEQQCLTSSEPSPIGTQAKVEPSSALLTRLPPRVLKTASAIGVTPFLNKLPELEARLSQKREDAEIRLLGNYQSIQTRIMLASTEAAHTAGVMRCEQAKANELANRLEMDQQRRASGNTITAVVISGLTDILLGALTVADAGVTIGIVGGIGGALQLPFAGMAIYSEDTYELRHTRNPLKEIWDGSAASQVFPPSVWAFLNEPRQEGESLRGRLIAKWTGTQKKDGHHEGDMVLLLGEGGPYTVRGLRRRAALFEELAASIDLMHDDLQVLIREVLVPAQVTL